jgi:formylglycine-generating enzyme required for sulfatase activity
MKNNILFSLVTIIIFFHYNGYGQDNLSFTVNGVSFNMVFVEGGTFVMGCTSEDGICYTGERPAHKVTLTDFFMGEFQITQELWYAVMGYNLIQQWLTQQITDRKYQEKINKNITGTPIPLQYTTFDAALSESLINARIRAGGSPRSKGDELFSAEDYSEVIPLNSAGPNCPMYYINYNDCELFCHRLNQLLADQLPHNYTFRMPTEAQWEYAARGGNKSRNYTYSGSNNIGNVAWYYANSGDSTSVVGKKMPNELGIYDMSGNVWEWCRDRYSENYYSNSPAVNPKGPDKGDEYVLRGGSWNKTGWCCRTATRQKDGPNAHTTNYGFRIVLEPPLKLTGSGFFFFSGNFNTSRLSLGKNLTFKANDVKFEMNFVHGGTFSMGCFSENNNCDSIEKPAHEVKLSNYYLDKFEVTQKLWQTVMGTTVWQQRDLANPSWGIYGESDNHPIYYVSYEECEVFCEKLNKMLYYQLPEGYRFVLPTEAQWEYAARGGSKNKGYIYSGSNKISKVAWWEVNSGQETRKVGLKSNNEVGFYDMSGNVWEWCRDWFEEDYYNYSSVTNPQGPLSGVQRVLRGGSWNLAEWHSRVTTRSYYEPQARSANLGFRIALEPAKEFFNVKSIKEAIKKLSPKFTSINNRNFRIDDINFEMIFVEGGTFTMGCTSNINDCFVNEEPTHSVTLSDFYIGKWQVTQQLWTKVMGTTVSEQRNLLDSVLPLYGIGDLLPMYYINYKECERFCEKLNRLLSKQLPEGYKVSLPTEAQWEYAARGGKKSKNYTYSGSNDIGKVAWFDDKSNIEPLEVEVMKPNKLEIFETQWTYVARKKLFGSGSTGKSEQYFDNIQDQVRKIGTKKENELGVYDMSGNIWEWCKDWFDGDYYIVSPSLNPTGPDYGYYRSLRGGSWRSTAQGCRVSCRSKYVPTERTGSCGLRLVLVKANNTR